jgi:hypothetical protein
MFSVEFDRIIMASCGIDSLDTKLGSKGYFYIDFLRLFSKSMNKLRGSIYVSYMLSSSFFMMSMFL